MAGDFYEFYQEAVSKVTQQSDFAQRETIGGGGGGEEHVCGRELDGIAHPEFEGGKIRHAEHNFREVQVKTTETELEDSADKSYSWLNSGSSTPHLRWQAESKKRTVLRPKARSWHTVHRIRRTSFLRKSRNFYVRTTHKARREVPVEVEAKNQSLIAQHVIPRSALIGDFNLLSRIGYGSFGEVFTAAFHCNTVAVKRIGCKVGTTIDEKRLLAWRQEVTLLSSLSSPNIVRVFGVCNNSDGTQLLVMEHLPITLYDKLKSFHGNYHGCHLDKPCESITHEFRISVAMYIASALVYLHGKNLIHRDLRSDNIMIKEENTAVLIDLGMCAKMGDTLAVAWNLHTDSRINPPEGMKTEKSDSFCLGLIMYELYTGTRLCFREKQGTRLCFREEQGTQGPDGQCTSLSFDQVLARMDDSDQYVKLMKECCSINENLRPSSTVILQRLSLQAPEKNQTLLVLEYQQKSAGYILE